MKIILTGRIGHIIFLLIPNWLFRPQFFFLQGNIKNMYFIFTAYKDNGSYRGKVVQNF